MKFKLLVLIVFSLGLSHFAFSQENELKNYTEPSKFNQKIKRIFVPFKKGQITIYDESKQHLSGELSGISDKDIFIKFKNDTNIYAFGLDKISKIKYKKGFGFGGGAILGATVSIGLSSLVLLDDNSGWEVLGFILLMGTIVPLTTLASGTFSAILSKRVTVDMHSADSELMLKTLKKKTRYKHFDESKIKYIRSGFKTKN